MSDIYIYNSRDEEPWHQAEQRKQYLDKIEEARLAQLHAASIVHDDSDRVPQFSRKEAKARGWSEPELLKAPTKHVHSAESNAQISEAQSIDGNEVNHRVYPLPTKKPKKLTNYPVSYGYDPYSHNLSDANAEYTPKTGTFPTKGSFKPKTSKK